MRMACLLLNHVDGIMCEAYLDNWALVGKKPGGSQTALPEIHLRGIVFGHTTYPDGSEITTSHIAHRKGECLVTVNGTHYVLGAINPDYDQQFPNARNLLLRSVRESAEEETFRLKPSL